MKGVDTEVTTTNTRRNPPFPKLHTEKRQVNKAFIIKEAIAVATEIPKSPMSALEQQVPSKKAIKPVSENRFLRTSVRPSMAMTGQMRKIRQARKTKKEEVA